MGAIFAVAVARVAGAGELPGERVALVAGAGEPLWEVCTALRGAGVGMSSSGGLARARELSNTRRSLKSRARARGTAEANTQSPGLTLLVGAEREGLPDDVVRACEHVAKIPIASESLNAAMAATVALYEMTRPSNRVAGS
jgi:TrmH family RNA methyltransferase